MAIKSYFDVKANYTEAQNNVELVAAVTGKKIYVEEMVISVEGTAGMVKLVTDTAGTPADVTQEFYLGVNGGVKIDKSYVGATGKNLGIKSTGVVKHSIHIRGYIQ